MNKEEIKKMRMDIGKFLHNYYLKFGEIKYEELVNKMGEKMSLLYGPVFNQDNLRIMEAEYVTLNAKIYEKNQHSNKETIT